MWALPGSIGHLPAILWYQLNLCKTADELHGNLYMSIAALTSILRPLHLICSRNNENWFQKEVRLCDIVSLKTLYFSRLNYFCLLTYLFVLKVHIYKTPNNVMTNWTSLCCPRSSVDKQLFLVVSLLFSLPPCLLPVSFIPFPTTTKTLPINSYRLCLQNL